MGIPTIHSPKNTKTNINMQFTTITFFVLSTLTNALTQDEFEKLPFCDQVGTTNTVVVVSADSTALAAAATSTAGTAAAAEYPTASSSDTVTETSNPISSAKDTASSLALVVLSFFAAMV
jgi:hypothetical protein